MSHHGTPDRGPVCPFQPAGVSGHDGAQGSGAGQRRRLRDHPTAHGRGGGGQPQKLVSGAAETPSVVWLTWEGEDARGDKPALGNSKSISHPGRCGHFCCGTYMIPRNEIFRDHVPTSHNIFADRNVAVWHNCIRRLVPGSVG